jgi:ketosteroid isomerase-like protein
MCAAARRAYGGHLVNRPRRHQMTTTADTTSRTDADIVRAGFEAFARGDGAAFAAMFHADATWNHRNDDRLGGVHDGRDRMMAFLAESAQLTAGTLRAVPERAMADGEGSVAVVTRVSGTRPDGRRLDDRQILLFTVDAGHIRTVDQYIGDPTAVTAFWD